MENRKCTQCGLVNFAGVTECARCQAFIPKVRPGAAGVNPFERDGTKPFNPLPLFGILAFVVAAAVVGYNVFGSDATKAATQPAPLTQAETEAHVERLRQQGMGEIQKDAATVTKINDDLKKNIEAAQAKPDSVKIKPPECKMTGSTSNPATGTYTPNYECK